MSVRSGITRAIVPGVAAPHGHYAHAVAHGGIAYLSGVLGNAGAGDEPPRDIDEQVRHCLRTLEAVLRGLGSDRTGILRLTIYATDVAHWPAIDAACAGFFGDVRPARTVVPCAELRLGSMVEIDAIAAVVDAGAGAAP